MTRLEREETGEAHRATDGMRRSAIGGLLESASASRRFLRTALRASLRLEGGMFWSATARKIMLARCGVRIGAYSYGPCFEPDNFPPGVVVGRYVSIAPGVRVFVRNHPLDRLSLHPFFYNSALGFVARDNIPSGQLLIGHDAWIGERAIVTPGCSEIGLGAVVGAGAVVTKSVPAFAIVAGNPAKVIRFRHPPEKQELILRSRWWERSANQCAKHLDWMTRPLNDPASNHPLLSVGQTQPAGTEGLTPGMVCSRTRQQDAR